MTDAPVIVHMRHIRTARLCAGGARQLFNSRGYSWNDFLAHGMSADELEATEDALAIRVSAIARKERENG